MLQLPDNTSMKVLEKLLKCKLKGKRTTLAGAVEGCCVIRVKEPDLLMNLSLNHSQCLSA